MKWIRGDDDDNSNEDGNYNITFSNLTEDTSYDFSVVPVREGYGGEGHSTNVVHGNTSCFGKGTMRTSFQYIHSAGGVTPKSA